MPRQIRVTIICSILVSIIFLDLFYLSQKLRTERNLADLVGAQDFVAYWSAYQVARRGENPYAVEPLLREQKAVGLNLTQPQRYFYPPWFLVALSPVFRFPFIQSALLWFCLNLALCITAGMFSWKLATNAPIKPPQCFIATMFMFPVLLTLKLGQISLLMTAATLGLLWAIKTKRDIFGGVCLVLVSFKPYSLYLVLILLAAEIVRSRRWNLLITALVIFAGLVILSWFQLHAAFVYWTTLGHDNDLLFTTLHTATLSTLVRKIIYAWTGIFPLWPVFVIPFCSAVLLLIWLFKHPSQILSVRSLVPVFCLSLPTAPYSWPFDQCALLFVQVTLVSWFSRSDVPRLYRNKVYLSLFSLQLLICLLTYIVDDLFYFFWIPFAFLFIWFRSLKWLDAHE